MSSYRRGVTIKTMKTKKTIMMAEDDVIVRRATAVFLQSRNYRVLEADNGRLALDLFRTERPDLVLSDLRLPEVDGMEILRTIVAESPNTPVLIVSGLGTLNDAIAAVRIGAWDYITKPIQDMELLLHAVEKALERSQMLRDSRRYQETLEQKIKEKTQELKNQQAESFHSQKLESVGRLAAGIAHEINTPTQYVGSNIEFLDEAFSDLKELIDIFVNRLAAAKEQCPGLAAAIKEKLDEIDWPYLLEEIPRAISQSRDGVHRVTSIVRAMKEFSHPGSRKKTLTDINKIIENTITVARNEWKYAAEVETELAPDLPAVPCLTDEIGQVLLNMLVNATHAIEEKLGKNPDEQKGLIKISSAGDGNWLEIKISDNGNGIPRKARGKIFEPFFTTKEVGRGTGQGMAIAHDVICKKHGGSITFETETGRGTTFIVRLPLR